MGVGVPAPSPSSPQGPAQLVIIHVGLALSDAPEPSHLVGVLDDEFPVVPLPGDDTLVLLLLQQLQDKVPQLDLPRAGGRLRLVGPIREGKPWGQEAGVRPRVRAPSPGLWVLLGFRSQEASSPPLTPGL